MNKAIKIYRDSFVGKIYNGLKCKGYLYSKKGHAKYLFEDKYGNEYVKSISKAIKQTPLIYANEKRRANEIGKKYNHLTVIEYIETKGHKAYYKCRCDCGNEIITELGGLKCNRKKSCGCIEIEKKKRNAEVKSQRKIQHDLEVKQKKQEREIYRQTHKYEIERHKILSNCWRAMHRRCENPKSHKWKDYGARGIRVCDEWEIYKSFEDWAINNNWQKGLSIDRINVNGNYEPSNCRWADAITQANNKRNSKSKNYLLAYKGKAGRGARCLFS